MMKNIILLTSLLSITSYAGECPQLSGTYFCSFSDGSFSPLKIEEEITSEPELVTYKFTFTRLPLDPDEFKASPTGVADEIGWINRCQNNVLYSIAYDGSMLGELSLSADQALVRKLNGNVVQTCPKN